jgi:hypothetical protein
MVFRLIMMFLVKLLSIMRTNLKTFIALIFYTMDWLKSIKIKQFQFYRNWQSTNFYWHSTPSLKDVINTLSTTEPKTQKISEELTIPLNYPINSE